jgi:hypothetical protein
VPEPRAEQYSGQRLADRAEIADAMAVYTRAADLNLPEEQAGVFTVDCVVTYHPGSPIVGRTALVESLRTSLARFERTSHHLGNIEIRFDDVDAASAQSTVIAWHRRTDGTEWTLYGRYVDRWVRTPDGWRMSSRELRAAGAVGRDDSTLPPLGRANS